MTLKVDLTTIDYLPAMSDDAQGSGGGQASGTMPVRGRIDRRDHLVEADSPLAELHRAAGGEEGGALVIPQLTELVRLARQSGVPLARTVNVATDDHDVSLAVRAWPEGEDVEIAIDEWREGPPHQPALADEATRRHDVLRAGADWSWETDDALRLMALDGAPVGPSLIGGSLTALLRLLPDDQGGLRILDALGSHRAFSGQRAQSIDNGLEYMLAAEPLFDRRGRFRGFRGVARVFPEPEETLPRDAFGNRVDRALRRALGRVVESADAIHAQAHGALRRDYADYAADISLAGRHLLGLVDDLVDLEAVERGSFTVQTGAIDLAEIARRAMTLLAAAAKLRDIRIFGPDAHHRLTALGDDRRVLQIVVNLLGNAIRYAPEHSETWLRVEEADGIAALVVADEGRGIAAADQERIFDKFDRLGADEPGGSGLGLYIARRLARMMNGDIAVDSAPGQGARFTLTLPTSEAGA